MSVGTAKSPATKRKSTELLRRTFSSVVLWGVVLWGLLAAPSPVDDLIFGAVLLFLTGFGLREFYDLAGHQGLPFYLGLGIGSGLLLVGGTFVALSGITGPSVSGQAWGDYEAAFWIGLSLVLLMRMVWGSSWSVGVAGVGVTLVGIFYLAGLMTFLLKIYFEPVHGGGLMVLYFIVVTKLSDTGAYLVGSVCGRHKMTPKISPGKTWEGFAGAILVSTLGSLGFAMLSGDNLNGINAGHAIAVGVILGSAAVMGDLIESTLKRAARVKDSGNWVPGIGGVLDLIDSLLFNAPLMYWYLILVLN